MAAPDLSGVTGNYLTAAQQGYSDTLNGSITAVTTTIVVHSVAGFSNNDSVFLWIDPGTTKAELVYGIVNTASSSLTSCVRGVIGSAAVHSDGATISQYVSSADHQAMRKHLLVQHKQDGTHANTITTDTINQNTVNNGVTVAGLNIKTGVLNTSNSVIPSNLNSAAAATWAWQAWTPTWGNLTIGNATVTARYALHGKTVFARLKMVWGSTTVYTGGAAAVFFTPPVTPLDIGMDNVSRSVFGQHVAHRASDSVDFNNEFAPYFLNSSTQINTSWSFAGTAPFAFVTGDSYLCYFMYEAA